MIFHKGAIKATRTAAMFAAAMLAASANAVADDAEELRYTVAVVSDAAQGRAILKESYQSAIEKLEQSNLSGIRGFNAANNLCVAYLKVGEKDAATESCQIAVARIEKIIATRPAARKRSYYDDYYATLLAMALSNLGVTYAANDDHELARDAFAAAIDTDSGASAPAVNMARLDKEA